MIGKYKQTEDLALTESIVGTIMVGASYLIRLYYFALIGRILLSWLPQLQENKIAEFLYKITEPYLAVFRRFIPPIGMIDISPIAAFFVFSWISEFLLRGLHTVLLFLF
ncbi:YggT family protein [Ammoniphilus resinae]|uniref:YggT family protein n=2 Tax=Ammoniphilus resinae TaxID=861532 RepID=A0ABS4GJS6_9BACL|nr:YggT family protein [Ammoniphilus resinae]MBP1930496.1 YggT family protein [Ammoniphilus resinae]